MDTIELAPYIFFQGNCREAMEFYKSVFGGELDVMDYADVPGDMPGKDEMKGKLMNATLKTQDVVIRGSDTQKASPEAKKVSICLTGSDEARLRKIFEGLSQGGKVFLPLEKQFWGDTFGSLTDKFKVEWMVNITTKKQPTTTG
jgi:PhnB protein